MNLPVFISYSRRDMAAVTSIRTEIERDLGLRCWMDIEGIESGTEDFVRTITPAIRNAKVFLFFLSTASQSSDFATKELYFAKGIQKRTILVRFNDDEMTDVFRFDFGRADIIDWRIPEQKNFPMQRRRPSKTHCRPA